MNTKHTKRINSYTTPYFIVILITALGWMVTHLVDRVLESPTIEYSILHAASDGSNKKIVFTIRNITKTKMFSNVTFTVTGNMRSPIIVSRAYIHSHGTSNQGDIEPNIQATDSAIFTIQQFQPNESFDLFVDFEGTKYPGLKLGNFTEQQTRGNTVRLVSFSLETWLVRNEYLVFSLLLVVGLTLIYKYYSENLLDGE